MAASRRVVALIVALPALVDAATADAATAPGAFAIGGGRCGLAAYGNPGPDDGPSAVLVRTPTADGLRFEASCAAFDVINFGPGFSQYFFGHSYGFSMGEAAPGALRLIGAVGGQIAPVEYNVGVLGTNPYRVRATIATSIGFADVIVPPAGAGAPNVGDPTTIKAVFQLDCVENSTLQLNTGAGVSVYTPAEYASDGSPYGTIFLTTDIAPGIHSGCPLTNAALQNEFAATVGTPVVVALSLGISTYTGVVPTPFNISKVDLYSNALNTVTLVITSADGAPLTGQSGKTYGPPGTLATITTTTTVTTTPAAPSTTTTLAGCAGTCGDGTIESACGEACECPVTADPIQAAYGCDGAAIVPPQDACVTCRNCGLTNVRCDVAASSTSTTVAGGATTTSTLVPSSCAGTGAAAARCVVDAFLAEGLCLDAAPAARVEQKFRAKLGAVRNKLQRVDEASVKKRARLERAALKKLAAVGRRAAALAGRKLSEACAARVAGLVGEATQRIEGS